MSAYPDAPKEEVLISALVEELEKRRLHNSRIEDEVRALETYQAKTATQSDQIKEINGEIEEYEDRISNLQRRKGDLELSLKDRGKAEAKKEKKIEAMIKANTQEIVDQLSSAEEVNQQVRDNQKRVEAETQINQLRAKSKKLTDEIEHIDTEKERQLSEAKFPIKNLSFDEDGVLFNEIPWNQLSSSEQLKISTAMGFAMNPKLKVLLIRDGSLLDNNNLKLLAEMAEKEDAQIWIERVGEGKEVSVIIEDGNIKTEE